MTNKILVVALAGISAVAMAQSDGQKSASTPSQASSAKEASPAKPTSAQPAEQRMHKPIKVTAEVSATPDSATSKPVGGVSAADDWEAPKAKTSAPTNGQPRVAPTMMQDGKKASLQTTSSTQSTSSTSSATSSDVKSPRDLASGQASGKRMHKPMTVTAEAGATADANVKQAPAAAKK